MIYQDSFNLVDDAEQYQVYPFGTTEDYLAIQAMSGHGKELSFFGTGRLYDPTLRMPPDNLAEYQPAIQYLSSSYASPETNQNDLAALPNEYGSDYEDGYGYSPGQNDAYTHVSLAGPSLGGYSTVPPPALAPISTHGIPYNMVSTKKRKASVESFPVEAPAPKRMALQDPSGEFFDLKSEPSPYSSLVPTPTTLGGSHLTYQLAVSPRLHGHQHSASNASQISVAATAPYTPTVSPSFTTANTEHSPRAPATPGPQVASAAHNPKLVRTSTISQHSPPGYPHTLPTVGHTQNFNPYTLFSPDSKARLHLDGDLDEVAKTWSEEELEARRKIVVFDRQQKGNDITASFRVVPQNEWKSNPRSVSCIWWAEKKEAYVTSVDTIALLEAIVAARFTVEEKNRIRRNLEGFKPDTVSKGKPETEEFFKVIMGFPNPKPRNIEKDVKVFPWRILSVALQKIISKYSASYASTAASVPQPKMYRPIEHHEYPYATRPAPDYHSSLQVAAFPMYEPQGRLPASATPSLHLSPHIPQGHSAHPGYGYGHQMVQHSHVQYENVMAAPVSAPIQYWQHHPGYTTDPGMHMASVSAPPSGYPREMIDPVDFHHRAIPMTHHHAYAGHH
ncbi:hypothetical protein LTR64_000138 [Lithohypha guttulata]|uniref:uncharacterized protein n=1 Tax=Lithohypha guttulata TaxID=1690604 RepID=UPI002DDFE41B|nr:hypothetical protein LTR51_007500 [Lithohypha guttulata]